jgi:hypothetical protein
VEANLKYHKAILTAASQPREEIDHGEPLCNPSDDEEILD